MTETRYKFLRLRDGKIMSEHGSEVWVLNEWQEVDETPELCMYGYHCSKRMSQAFSYVQGEIVAKVEVAGDVDSSDDKEAWQRARLVDVRVWGKSDSVALAIFAAELVLENFESQFPNDDRPRKAIEAAKVWLSGQGKPTTSAAWSAESALAAESARSAARSAWCRSRSAASAAGLAASAASAASAAWSAESAESALAAESASAAVGSAARSADVQDRIADWMEKRFETITVYGGE